MTRGIVYMVNDAGNTIAQHFKKCKGGFTGREKFVLTLSLTPPTPQGEGFSQMPSNL